MSITADSLLNIKLPLEPNLGDGSQEDLLIALTTIHEAIVILQNEVERIRIATGTAPPP